jgi:hypothetical protein
VPGPFIFIATNRLKPGALEAETRRVPQLCEFVEANEPRLLAFNEYADDDGAAVSVVQVHADAESMEFHMGVVRAQAERAFAETLEAHDEHPGVRNAERRRARHAGPSSRRRTVAHRPATPSGRVHTARAGLTTVAPRLRARFAADPRGRPRSAAATCSCAVARRVRLASPGVPRSAIHVWSAGISPTDRRSAVRGSPSRRPLGDGPRR